MLKYFFPRLTTRQLKLLNVALGTVGTLLLIAAVGGSIYYFFANVPQRAAKRLQAGMGLMALGKYEPAIEQFTKSIEIWPSFAEGYLERGVAHGQLKQTDPAMDDFARAIELNPNLARAYSARGVIYRQKGDIKHALEDLTKSVDIASSLDAYYERGQIHEQLGEHQQAIDDYDKAIHEWPSAPYVYRARGLAKRNMGDIAGYQADRDTADRLNPRL